jgi:membrane protease YdiL (CAAX protease family)
MTEFIKRHPLASYFLLAIALSWAGILAIVLPGAIPAPPAEAERLFVAVYLAMLVGPSVAGLAITAITGGRDALREFRDRLLAWRVGGAWYAVALFTAPLAIGVTLLALSLASPDFTPALFAGTTDAAGPVRTAGRLTFVLMGLAVGIGAGFFEELGWTGVAVPRMLARHGLVATGVGVGLVWGAWHFLAIWWGSADAFGTVPISLYLLVALFSFLPPYRVLMVWVYEHTHSLMIGVLMHASLTSSMLILGPAVSGRDLLIFDLAFGATLWIAAAVLIVLERRRARAPMWRSPLTA